MSQPNQSEKFIIDQSGHGARIDQWLAKQQPQFSRSYWSEQVKQGNVLLNDSVCLPKTKLKIDDVISLQLDCFQPPSKLDYKPQSIELDIIGEDEHILVINKPSGLVVHPGAGNYDNTLLNGLLAYLPDAIHIPRAGIVHRLDKETTGIMIVAKTLEAYHGLVQQLQDRLIKREYQALVYGHIISGGRIETQFGRHPKNRLKMAVVNVGKEAITNYSIDKQFGHFTLLKVQLETGRTHQIRVHMAYIGHPIVGDSLYGQRLKLPPNHTETLKTRLQHFKRQALHAFRLSLTHPISKKPLTWTASIPDDFRLLLEAIESNLNDNQT